MSLCSSSMVQRAQRFVPRPGNALDVELSPTHCGALSDISRSGIGVIFDGELLDITAGMRIERLVLATQGARTLCGSGEVVRVESRVEDGLARAVVGIRFDQAQDRVLDVLTELLALPFHFSAEVLGQTPPETSAINASTTPIDRYYGKGGHELFAKCQRFRGWMSDMLQKQLYQRLYRLTVTGPLDHRISVFDADLHGERDMVCFDSNSYLGLHLHPKVIERTIEVTKRVGYGTASAQLLCGTNRYLCELEHALCEFHGREATMVFPSGFAANIGTLAALVRKNDALIRDQIAHASIQEGCKAARTDFNRTFFHNDMDSLRAVLEEADDTGHVGKLVVTDGVFSMHGRIAPLPRLVMLARQYGARLMVDDAHGLGVLGPNGGGIEEHFSMPASVDVLMGTLSKALGAVGGYITGSSDLINYLRFFAPSGMFTTALPAAVCAGLVEALRLIRAEPEHRIRLWHNIRRFVPALREAGFIVSDPESPIITVFLGEQGFMLQFSRELADAGIKCGYVAYPVIAKGESILRFTLNARHSDDDLEYAVDTLTRIGRRFGMLGKSRDELTELGRRVAIASAA